MIKVGIFGDETTNPELLEQLNKMSGVEVAGVHFSGNAVVPEGFTELLSPVGLMDVSDAILILSDKSISNDLVRLILRKSKHVYLKTIPNLHIGEINELIDLEKEAGIITYIYNPFNYIPCFDPFGNNYEKPLLINIRTCFGGTTIKPSHEMLLLVTALNRLVQSSFKKLDVFGLYEADNQLTVNLRIEYENGCVVNLTISQKKLPGYCEIFEQKGRTKFEFQTPLYVTYPQLSQGNAAVGNFLRLIQNQEKKTNSFDNLLNGVQIVHEIREHLRFNGIDF
ncbi:MAG TPA: hypothetical protein VFC65_20120 [Prolixibacteraceae bacterium]|nr:hypothetical protein [Prolixibacteraceae bacterium]